MQTTPNISEAEQALTKPANDTGSQYSVQRLEKARAENDTVLKVRGDNPEAPLAGWCDVENCA